MPMYDDEILLKLHLSPSEGTWLAKRYINKEESDLKFDHMCYSYGHMQRT